jgi:hypothetical protein
MRARGPTGHEFIGNIPRDSHYATSNLGIHALAIRLTCRAKWTAPEFLEAIACRMELTYHAFLPCIVTFLILFRGHVPACRVNSFRVVPVNPFDGREHDIINADPRPFPVDELFLTETVQ